MSAARLWGWAAFPLLITVYLPVTAPFAHAGEPRADCRRPYVFSEGAVNLVVLPYDYHSAKHGAPASETSRQIPLLLQANGLLQMIRYGGVGSVNLVNPAADTSCTPEIVQATLTTGAFQPGRLRPGHGLILVWGTLYEEGDEFQLQTFMRILRRDRDESFSLGLPGENAMVVRPSTTTLAFAPQTLSRTDLLAIHAAFERAIEVRAAPSDTAKVETFRFYQPDSRNSSYTVQEARSGWLRVQGESGRDGWIKADFDWGKEAMSARLPEMHFIGLAAGYLRARVAAERTSDHAPRRTLDWVHGALNRYLAAAGPDADDVVGAVGRQLVALTACVQARDGAPEWVLADTLATRAADDLPNDEDAQRLAGAMMLRADEGRGAVAGRSALVERRLARAAMIGGGGFASLRDLATLYRLASRNGGAGTATSLAPDLAAMRLREIGTGQEPR